MSHNILYFIALVSRKTLMRTFVFGWKVEIILHLNFCVYFLVYCKMVETCLVQLLTIYIVTVIKPHFEM